MRSLLNSHKVKLIILATIISLTIGAFTIEKGAAEHVFYFGFPGTFITLNKHVSEFPAGLGINPIQFAGNVGIIWLILFYLFKAFHKLVLMVRKKKAHEAITEMLDRIRQIDATPSMTLRQRETLIYNMIKQDREKWCLFLGTVLVPNFEFQAQGEMTDFLHNACVTVMKHREKLRIPTEEMASAYAVTALSLHILYLIGGSEDVYLNTMRQHMDNYLLPRTEDRNEAKGAVKI